MNSKAYDDVFDGGVGHHNVGPGGLDHKAVGEEGQILLATAKSGGESGGF
jgi:hypothetical protein